MDIGFALVSDTDDDAGDGKSFRGPHRGAVVKFAHARFDLIEARRDLRIGFVHAVDHGVIFFPQSLVFLLQIVGEGNGFLEAAFAFRPLRIVV